MFREIQRRAFNGLAMLVILLALVAVAVWGLIVASRTENTTWVLVWMGVFILVAIGFAGLFAVQPNDAKVLVLFGRYVGTVRDQGLWWANPFYQKRRI